MSERRRRASIIGLVIAVALTVVIVPLTADARSNRSSHGRSSSAALRTARRFISRTTTTSKATTTTAQQAKVVTTTTAKPTTTTAAPTTTVARPAPPAAPPAPVVPPVAPPAAPVAPPAAPCVGVPMTQGQADINTHPNGTVFCLSGVHNWTLHPRDHQVLVGPAVLDGGHTNPIALVGDGGVGVTIQNLEVRNYVPTSQQSAIGAGDHWILRDVVSHDNGTVGATYTAGGYGAAVGYYGQVIGGRYYNNRQGGLSGGGAINAIIDGVEIDHNNFTDDSYTTQNIDCNFEAGGMKWIVPNLTIQNSKIHDNACRGLWSDIGASGSVVRNNQIYNNWDEGLFIEISGSTTVTGNSITGNGFRTQLYPLASRSQSALNGCMGYLGAGILVGTSGQTHTSSGTIQLTGNNIQGNCNGITAVEQHRTDGGVCGTVAPTCELRHLRIDGNTFTGSSDARALNRVGYFNEDGADLTSHDIVFGSGNHLSGMNNCQFGCRW
jgi:parallel beta-helix repeat protein